MANCNIGMNVSDTNPGRKFEVYGVTRAGVEEIIGWNDKPDGGDLLKGARLWPRFVSSGVRPAKIPTQNSSEDGQPSPS